MSRCVAELARSANEHVAGSNTAITSGYSALRMHDLISNQLTNFGHCENVSDNYYWMDRAKLTECCDLYSEEAARVGFEFE